ncbi:PaaX family transcriptional regulator [Flexivirga endophytica]|uniref:PaaX family transcriptional regulator n=1 Tax=Flexivirga endophytica TaxID=1849103 RepID=A0A916WSS3_9MICO|nr:PaaX family transcriptional regulator C-terminal domain-containing protein [Flexivirga endophytica]GGB31259.1 PaaX family transcriptional regulator [Flexivirga endophytica]GHB52189.1 PaaX family transcriptional regulator [Flexivirga endophytica]
MTAADGSNATQRTRRTRTLIVTFLGSVVRQQGGWLPIAGTIDLMGQLGVDAPSVRTAVFRLKQRGWLEAEARNGARGYTLTEHAVSVLAQGDEVIWHARRPADLADGWCIVNFSVPESDRSRRYKLRTHLSHLGFGNVGTAMWLAPARMRSAAEEAIADLGLDKYAAVFVGNYMGTQDLTALLYDSWDLAGIDQSYRDFTEHHRPMIARLESPTAIEPEEAFTTYLSIIDAWRRLPFRDPGLPHEVLAEGWSAPEAVAVFERLVELLEDRALAHAAQFWNSSSTNS